MQLTTLVSSFDKLRMLVSAYSLVLLLISASCLLAQNFVTTTGYIGSHKLSFKAQSITDCAVFDVKGSIDYLAITEIYPDTPSRVDYSYKVTAKGIGTYERRHRSVGFGPVTYFLKVRSNPVGPVKVTCARGTGGLPVLISSVWGVTKKELDGLLAKDKFLIMGLIPWVKAEEQDKLVALFSRGVTARPKLGITTGFACEIRYASQDSARVKAEIAACREWARKYKMPAMLGLVSWWSGTPQPIPDGEGGLFGDLKYQQVCYSPDADVALNADLKKLIGERYNLHYGLSTPNIWSNCPWLTMNSPALNTYRHKRIDEAVGLLKDISGGDMSWLSSLYMENEPRYWDSDCEAGMPTSKRKALWADFNPMVVSDAKKDGVELNPADGLSNEELSWLHRNVGRYYQDTIDAARRAFASHGISAHLPLYTHSLQLQRMFPGVTINHPASEWAFTAGSRTGLEGMWSTLTDFQRVREWGRWANVDREENDGYDTAWHLWDLRVAYSMGADLYNSYNWHAIGPQRVIDYMNEFIAELPVVLMRPANVRCIEPGSFRMKTPMNLQAFSRLELPVSVARKIKGSAFVGITFADGRSVCSEREPIAYAPGQRTLALSFTTPAESSWKEEILVVLYIFDEGGRLSLNTVVLNHAATDKIVISLDQRLQRALSLAVISRSEKKPLGK